MANFFVSSHHEKRSGTKSNQLMTRQIEIDLTPEEYADERMVRRRAGAWAEYYFFQPMNLPVGAESPSDLARHTVKIEN